MQSKVFKAGEVSWDSDPSINFHRKQKKKNYTTLKLDCEWKT